VEVDHLHVNAVPYKETKTTRVENILGGQRTLLNYICEEGHGSKQLLELKYKKFICDKDMMKELFGQQMCCKNYNHRTWIWSISNQSSCLYVCCSSRGLTVEVLDENESIPEDATTANQAFELYKAWVKLLKDKLKEN